MEPTKFTSLSPECSRLVVGAVVVTKRSLLLLISPRQKNASNGRHDPQYPCMRRTSFGILRAAATHHCKNWPQQAQCALLTVAFGIASSTIFAPNRRCWTISPWCSATSSASQVVLRAAAVLLQTRFPCFSMSASVASACSTGTSSNSPPMPIKAGFSKSLQLM